MSLCAPHIYAVAAMRSALSARFFVTLACSENMQCSHPYGPPVRAHYQLGLLFFLAAPLSGHPGRRRQAARACSGVWPSTSFMRCSLMGCACSTSSSTTFSTSACLPARARRGLTGRHEPATSLEQVHACSGLAQRPASALQLASQQCMTLHSLLSMHAPSGVARRLLPVKFAIKYV